MSAESVKNFVYEWSLNILILLFGTTTLVQAFIVPTPSMDSTVLVGDHLLVDKLSYAPAGAISKYLPAAWSVHSRLRVPHRDAGAQRDEWRGRRSARSLFRHGRQPR
jgi:signal peptidase I